MGGEFIEYSIYGLVILALAVVATKFRGIFLYGLCLILAVTIVSGLARLSPANMDSGIHNFFGHLLFSGSLALLIARVGVSARRCWVNRSLWPVFSVFGCLVLAGLTLLAGLTGYLRMPSPADDAPINVRIISEEANNRFTVIHQFFLPTCIGLVLSLHTWFAWRRRANIESSPSEGARISKTVTETGNPYQSPAGPT